MLSSQAVPARMLRACAQGLLFAGAALLAGCAHYYVDGGAREVPVAAMARPAQPKPVQLAVDFQTLGITDARATAEGKAMVVDAVRASGLFSDVREGPVEGGGVLRITLNHLPPTENMTARGLMTGLTLGLAGQQQTDGYTCTVSYLKPGQQKIIVKTARSAIHTTVGAASTPANSFKAANRLDAVNRMVRQILSASLDELSHDPEFQ
jgi:hypothetical protein